ncbi:MAG: NUDIX domain-containing protein [Pseudomonadales bacterium]|jgi:isopentenyl-diphosphate delta-isomerase type 1|nr:NUDIX domain-containing protein [Pseudomonadales bacterium]MDP7594863.1 NUDIX domain-containing protein [Pseudomonadales bacterium]HJN51212.1 NUDIX domain-containing protein [Pseudomonadales bacterium]|tara:strand:+ start:94 stop:630 length:537 start_codon:yes stop_codon:yes gene_type:complete
MKTHNEDTTDDLDEIFDVVNEDDEVVGQASRMECNSNPQIIHRSVFVLIYNDEGQVLWQKRSMTKDTCPGAWVTSTSGHVSSGDTYTETAIRETIEELGVSVEVEFLGKFLFRYATENEYSAIFRAHCNGPFDFNPEEISDIKFMYFSEILKLEHEARLELSQAVHYIAEAIPGINSA